jgi:hypothetical protein
MCSYNHIVQIGFFIFFISSLFLFTLKIKIFLDNMGTRADVMVLIEELEELKNFAREHAEKEPNYVKFASDVEYKRLWNNLWTLEQDLLREAYYRNIRLVVDGEEVRLRTILDALDAELDAAEGFKRYLAGKFQELWGNALESFIDYHTDWNLLMRRIIDAERR